LLLVVGAQAAAWVWAGWVLPMASLLLLPLSLLLAHGLLAYRHATGNRLQLATLFGQYVPPELVDRMSLEPGRYTMRSRSTELTVLFADVHGFSGLAEHMPPAELGAMMNMIFSHLTDVVREHRGTLDKYIGDSVMAFWGAPLDDPDHAERAVAAALAMRQRLPTLHAEMATHAWPPLDINIGVNTGTMVVGDMGSRHRRAYTVMGDAVNMAARVQALCSQFGLGLVIGDATQQSLSGVLCLALGHVKVRGRDAPIQVWHPLPFRAGESHQADVFCREWARMRLAVEGGRFAEAQVLLDVLQANLSLQPLCRWQRRQLQAGPTLDQPRG
jgi:adenylate cyclase